LISQRTAGEGHHAYAKARDAIETIEAAGSEFVKEANANAEELLAKTQWLSKRVRCLEGELIMVKKANTQATEHIRALSAKVDASATLASPELKTTQRAGSRAASTEESTNTSEQAEWMANRVKFLESELLHIRTTANKRVQALKHEVDQLRTSTAAAAPETTRSTTEETPSSSEVERLRQSGALADQTMRALRAENAELTETIADLRRANAGLLRQLRGARAAHSESAHVKESQPIVSAEDGRLEEQSRVIEEQKKLIAQLTELLNSTP
jgi:chromosome segregation ATPase